jgi:hypothetical protein
MKDFIAVPRFIIIAPGIANVNMPSATRGRFFQKKPLAAGGILLNFFLKIIVKGNTILCYTTGLKKKWKK